MCKYKILPQRECTHILSGLPESVMYSASNGELRFNEKKNVTKDGRLWDADLYMWAYAEQAKKKIQILRNSTRNNTTGARNRRGTHYSSKQKTEIEWGRHFWKWKLGVQRANTFFSRRLLLAYQTLHKNKKTNKKSTNENWILEDGHKTLNLIEFKSGYLILKL